MYNQLKEKISIFTSRYSNKIPLKLVLIFLFVGQIVLAVSLTGWLSFSNGQKAVNELATQLRNELTTRIQQHLHTYLEMPHLVNQLNADAVRLGVLKLDNLAELKKYLWYERKSFNTVSYVAIGTETGEYIGVQFFDDGSSMIQDMDKSNGKSVIRTWDVDDEGNQVSITKVQENYDPRSRPWYIKAVKADKPIWTEVYAYFSGVSMTISADQPIYDMNDQLVGVASSDLTLSEVSKFLKNLKIGRTGQTFIMERTGDIIATSTDEIPFIKTIETETIKRLAAIDSQDAITQATARFLLQAFTDLKQITATQHLSFTFEGERYYLQVSPLKDGRGLDWLTVVVIPEADFMENINANTHDTILLTFAALLVAIFIGFIVAQWIIRPILQLNVAAKKIANGQWDQALPIERHDEIGELAHSFSSMESQLKGLIDNLEKRVQERTQELSQAYKRLKQSQTQLIQSEKMASLGQMVAGVAHEINTPLGYIKNNVELTNDLLKEVKELVDAYNRLVVLLTTGEATEEAINTQFATIAELAAKFEEDDTFVEMEQLFADTLHGIARISELVINLKNFSRLDLAAVSDINLNESLDSVLIIAHNMLKYKTEVRKHYSEIPTVECSPSQINQVFLNLLTNAVQAIEEKGIIQITTSFDDQFVHVTIQDTGKGIPKKILAKVFDPFFTTKQIGEGTGLGLSIVYQIIKQHKGHIRVVSQEGKGSKFIVSLPRQLKMESMNATLN